MSQDYSDGAFGPISQGMVSYGIVWHHMASYLALAVHASGRPTGRPPPSYFRLAWSGLAFADDENNPMKQGLKIVEAYLIRYHVQKTSKSHFWRLSR